MFIVAPVMQFILEAAAQPGWKTGVVIGGLVAFGAIAVWLEERAAR